ncbi:hypothetical protein ASPWEDRAFT_744436, partial [Aspergillus wentii DTO 134E9]
AVYIRWDACPIPGIHAGIKAVGQISHGPQFINCESQRSDSPLPYPDGTMDFIIMSQVPWEKVGTIFRDLSLVQLQSVRTQLTYILDTCDRMDSRYQNNTQTSFDMT